jgi:hypothetical protein
VADTYFPWFSDIVAGGGATHPRPRALGSLHLTDEGLSVEPNDDYYAGTIAAEQAVELARAILARFAR